MAEPTSKVRLQPLCHLSRTFLSTRDRSSSDADIQVADDDAKLVDVVSAQRIGVCCDNVDVAKQQLGILSDKLCFISCRSPD